MNETQENINIKEVSEIWIKPEIKRRKENGQLNESFILHKAQIVFYPDGKRKIRLNDEVKAKLKVKLNSDVVKNVGDMVFIDELDGISEIKLSDTDDPDCAHITIIEMNNNWYLSFDATYNKKFSKKHISTARQFYETAKFALGNKYMSAFVDNLYSATELLAKSMLLNDIASKEFREKASHKSINQKFNLYAKLGNIEPKYAKLLNELSELRKQARYLKGEKTVSAEEANKYLEMVKEMIGLASERIL